MNTEKAAAALNTASLALAELAEALMEQPQAAPAVEGARASDPPQTALASQPELSPFLEDEQEIAAEITYQAERREANVDSRSPEGSLANCPKHRVPFTEGAYGPYCKQATDDPAWGKQKGDRLWCKITPKNAAEYLRIKAA